RDASAEYGVRGAGPDPESPVDRIPETVPYATRRLEPEETRDLLGRDAERGTPAPRRVLGLARDRVLALVEVRRRQPERPRRRGTGQRTERQVADDAVIFVAHDRALVLLGSLPGHPTRAPPGCTRPLCWKKRAIDSQRCDAVRGTSQSTANARPGSVQTRPRPSPARSAIASNSGISYL